MSYLGELLSGPRPTTQQTKDAARETGATKWFPHAIDFVGDLDTAFALWDAVSPLFPLVLLIC